MLSSAALSGDTKKKRIATFQYYFYCHLVQTLSSTNPQFRQQSYLLLIQRRAGAIHLKLPEYN